VVSLFHQISRDLQAISDLKPSETFERLIAMTFAHYYQLIITPSSNITKDPRSQATYTNRSQEKVRNDHD
jgi:hypothetical protein